MLLSGVGGEIGAALFSVVGVGAQVVLRAEIERRAGARVLSGVNDKDGEDDGRAHTAFSLSQK